MCDTLSILRASLVTASHPLTVAVKTMQVTAVCVEGMFAIRQCSQELSGTYSVKRRGKAHCITVTDATFEILDDRSLQGLLGLC